MIRFLPILVACILFASGCKSSPDNDIGAGSLWLGNSVPRQTEPEIESAGSSGSVRTAGATLSSKDEAEKTVEQKGSFLAKWFPGGADKAAPPKRVPLPLTEPDPKGSASRDDDLDF
jgi:hypothetical protein